MHGFRTKERKKWSSPQVMPHFTSSCTFFQHLATSQNVLIITYWLGRTALGPLSDPKNPKDEAVQLLRLEMQRCLNSLKGKRQKISQLQEELQRCQSQMNKLQTQLEEAKLSSEVSSPNQSLCLSWSMLTYLHKICRYVCNIDLS